MFRCPECRTRRKDWGLFAQHLQTSGHALCRCGGYHYAHRPGSPYCTQNPVSALLVADRQGVGGEDLARCAKAIIEDTPHAAAKVRELMKKWELHEIV